YSKVELIHGYQFLASNKLDSPESGTRLGQLSIERQLVRNCGARYNFFTKRTAGNWNALDVETRIINCLVLTEQSNVDKQTNNLTFRMENMDRKCWSHAVKAGYLPIPLYPNLSQFIWDKFIPTTLSLSELDLNLSVLIILESFVIPT
ncbi:hypothetical protein BpHYR1_047658, partial [Brachionus plicatilis]